MLALGVEVNIKIDIPLNLSASNEYVSKDLH